MARIGLVVDSAAAGCGCEPDARLRRGELLLCGLRCEQRARELFVLGRSLVERGHRHSALARRTAHAHHVTGRRSARARASTSRCTRSSRRTGARARAPAEQFASRARDRVGRTRPSRAVDLDARAIERDLAGGRRVRVKQRRTATAAGLHGRITPGSRVKPTAGRREAARDPRFTRRSRASPRNLTPARQAELMTRSLWLLGCALHRLRRASDDEDQDPRRGDGAVGARLRQVKASRCRPAARAPTSRVRATSDARVSSVRSSRSPRSRSTKHAKLGVDDPRGRALGLVLAPVTIPISGDHHGALSSRARMIDGARDAAVRTETLDCTQRSFGAALELQFPSGDMHRGKTDAERRAGARDPTRRAVRGQGRACAVDQVTAELHYEQSRCRRSPCPRRGRGVPRAASDCGRVTLKLTINERGPSRGYGCRRASGAAAHLHRYEDLLGIVFPRTLRATTLVLPAPTS